MSIESPSDLSARRLAFDFSLEFLRRMDMAAEWTPFTSKKGRQGWKSKGGLVRYVDPRRNAKAKMAASVKSKAGASKARPPRGEKIVNPPVVHAPNPMLIDKKTGVTKSARVGLPGMEAPPPPKSIPRLPNLTEVEREVESKFADAFLADPDGVARAYIEKLKSREIGDGPNIFNTDDAKLLSPDYNPKDADDDDVKDARSKFNVCVHQTANAIAKRAFLQYLDELPEDKRTVLVTSGGVAAGKGHALANAAGTSELAGSVGAIWDAAGEQNGTENPWILEECEKRGIKPIFAFVHADPVNTWENPERGVVERAGKKGRMVDARLFADSYAIGAKNFKKFHEKNAGRAQFIFLDNTSKPKQVDGMPKAAVRLSAEKIYRRAIDVLKKRAKRIKPAVARGGSIGQRIWGKPKEVAQPSVKSKTAKSPVAPSRPTVARLAAKRSSRKSKASVLKSGTKRNPIARRSRE